jgi:ABC-type Fe3+ transport system substrate-binding protein
MARDSKGNDRAQILAVAAGEADLAVANTYYLALMLSGKKATAEWAKGVVANMARDSKGNDRAQILAVAAGEADLAVANTYYLALMLSGKKRCRTTSSC